MNPLLKEARLVLAEKYVRIYSVRKVLKELQDVEGSKSDEVQETILLLISREKELKSLYRQKQVNFVALEKGSLGLGGRPSHDKMKMLKEEGVTTVVTLLKKEEKSVTELGAAIESLAINWIWFPLAASKLREDEQSKAEINNLYADLIERLKKGEKIFIHCAAGVHRTGAFSNGLLLKMGFSESESKDKVYEIRPVTTLDAIPKHWSWSKRMVE